MPLPERVTYFLEGVLVTVAAYFLKWVCMHSAFVFVYFCIRIVYYSYEYVENYYEAASLRIAHL